MLKLVVGDLHLHTKEMRSTKRMVDNNVVMLEGLYDVLVEEPGIKLLEFIGDIGHAVPTGKNTLTETAKWTHWFRKIGELMKERYDATRIRVLESGVVDGESTIGDKIADGNLYPLFVVKGNHDIDNEGNFTYYDMLLAEGIMCNPDGLIIDETTQVNFYNYGEADKVYEKEDGVEQVIGLYHDVIANEESPFWVGVHPAYESTEILRGIDLGIVGHIHQKEDPIFVETDEGTSVQWTFGSMGRTSFTQGQVRDVGYCALVDTEDLEKLGTVEVPLIPKDEYFNFRAEIEKRQKDKTYEDFSLGLGDDIKRTYEDPRDEIRNMDGMEDSVREVCIEIMDEIMGES